MAPGATDPPRRLLDETSTAKLDLVENRPLDKGVMALVYQPAEPAGDGADGPYGEEQT